MFPAPFAVLLNKNDKNYVEPDICVICDKNKITDKGCDPIISRAAARIHTVVHMWGETAYMKPKVVNKNKGSIFHGGYVGRDNVTVNIVMLKDSEREFVVTHNARIKPVAYFTGRETELQELRQRIEEGRKSVLVSGMGGIGKTHICRKLFKEYLDRHAEDENEPFCHIGYIEYSGDMGASLLNCLKFKHQDRPEKNREAAWRELEYLAAGGKLLLFVDNVDKAIGTDPGLQRLKDIPGAVVLTSRQASFSDEFEPYRIGFLDMEQCVKIYQRIRWGNGGRKINPEEVQDLEYIIENFAGRHTITIELLAHLARVKLWTVKRLREELEQKGFRLTFHKDGKLINIQESYEALYDLSEMTEAEQNILEAFSVFPYIPLAAEVCNQWLLADAGVNEDDDILVGLYQKGWLQFDVEKENYALHPVFAQFIYEKSRPEEERHHGLIEECRKCMEIPESGSILESKEYIPFAESILENIDMKKDLKKVEFMNALAGLLQYTSEYDKMENLCRESLKICKDTLGENHLGTVPYYINLAYVYNHQGKCEEAKEMYIKSLQISKKALGEEHPTIAMSYGNLAAVYLQQKKYSEAEELYKKSLYIREKMLGKEHLDTAQSYNALACVYIKEEKYKEAEELLKKSLHIREKVLGKKHPDIAQSYNDLAYVYVEEGKNKEAEELYKKSLRIREQMLGEEHLDTAQSYNNLANMYERQGEYEIALSYYNKASKILASKCLTIDHPDVRIILGNILRVTLKKKKKAHKLFRILHKLKFKKGVS